MPDEQKEEDSETSTEGDEETSLESSSESDSSSGSSKSKKSGETRKDTGDDSSSEDDTYSGSTSDSDQDEEEDAETSESSGDEEWAEEIWPDGGEELSEELQTRDRTRENLEAEVHRIYAEAMKEASSGRVEAATARLRKLWSHSIFEDVRKKIEAAQEGKIDSNSKLIRLYVSLNNRLLSLDPAHKSDYLLEILHVHPHRVDLWHTLGDCLLQQGRLSDSLSALRQASALETPSLLQSFALVFYLKRHWAACLSHISHLAESCPLSSFPQMQAILCRISQLSPHFAREIKLTLNDFNVDEFLSSPSNRNVLEKLERFEVSVTESIEKRQKEELRAEKEEEEELHAPLTLNISANMTFPTVITVFLDVFDRIKSYSSVFQQKIEFSEWEDRQLKLHVEETVRNMIRRVEAVERCGSEEVRDGRRREEAVRKSKRRAEGEESSVVPSASADDRSSITSDLDSGIFSNELSRWLGLEMQPVQRLRETCAIASRSATPPIRVSAADEEVLLAELRSRLRSGTHNIIHLLESVLSCISSVCPLTASVPPDLIPLLIGCYRRIASCSCKTDEYSWILFSLLLAELGEESAVDELLSVEMSESEGWPEEGMWKRFAWAQSRFLPAEHAKLQYLYSLKLVMDPDELIFTANGVVWDYDVQKSIDDLEKKHRIASVKSLWDAGDHEQLCSILSRDINFSHVSISEMTFLLDVWLSSLRELGRFDDYLQLLIRILHFLFECEPNEFDEKFAREVLKRLIKMDEVPLCRESLQSAATLLCCLLNSSASSLIPKIWIALYHTVDRLYKDVPTLEYLGCLDSNEDNERMPRRELDVLLKAHEKMGEDRMCGASKGAFIVLYMRALKEKIFDDPDVLTELLKSKNGWMWANVQEEVIQCLHCAFGRYTKKKRMMFDHGNECEPKEEKLWELALPLALPYPLPEHDDKERLGHDVVDLITSRFPHLLDVSEERKTLLDNLDYWLRLNASNRVREYQRTWDYEEEESVLQATVWYVVALSYFRITDADKSAYYAKLFITSGKATGEYFSRAVLCSAWVILGYQKAATVFQSSEMDMLEGRLIESSFLPFRVAISIEDTSMSAHVQLASSIYQVATRLHRFGCQPDYVASLRADSAFHFERALQVDPGGYGELQWMCYFFLGKLNLKKPDFNIITVLENFYESACSCELHSFYYPVKINLKKQQNLEPVELHYHAHAAVLKYLQKFQEQTPPSLNTLISIFAYLRAFQNHGVVRSNLSLFHTTPDVLETVIRLTVEATLADTKEDIEAETTIQADVSHLTNKMLLVTELVDEIWQLCYKAFEIVCERFPHIKAHYRLAEMNMEKGNVQRAYDEVFKSAFRRKRQEDHLFTNIVQITAMDVDRSDSFQYHVYRLFILGLQISEELKNIGNVAAMLGSLIEIVARKDETSIVDRLHVPLLRVTVQLLETMLPHKDTHAAANAKHHFVKLWNIITKNVNVHSADKLHLVFVHKRVEKLITGLYGSANAVLKESLNEERQTKMLRKRKAAGGPSSLTDADMQPVRPPPPPPRFTQSQPLSQPLLASQDPRSQLNDFIALLLARQQGLI